jgi:hypothetical protein
VKSSSLRTANVLSLANRSLGSSTTVVLGRAGPGLGQPPGPQNDPASVFAPFRRLEVESEALRTNAMGSERSPFHRRGIVVIA